MTVFGLNKNVVTGLGGYLRSQMTLVMKILWRIGVCMFHPRLEDIDCVSVREVYLLHALFMGDYLYSFAHLMIDDMWDMYEDKNRRNIPYGSYISEILNRCGAMPKDEYGEMVTPEFRVISKSSFLDLKFLQSPTYYIIEDRITMQRVMFQKNVVEVPGHQIPIPNPHLDTTKLLKNEKPSSKFQEEPKEHQALEAGHEELDREKRAEILFQEMEKRAEIRAHAIIWDIERQRYFYEKEQEQLRMAWNQFNGVDDFQFPQICHTSFHPPQEGSQYYDPTQSNEIPKAFQSIYHDIYGPRR